MELADEALTFFLLNVMPFLLVGWGVGRLRRAPRTGLDLAWGVFDLVVGGLGVLLALRRALEAAG
jgi:hypothetical protein